MARSRALKITAAIGAALLLITGGASAAVADQLAFDVDGLAPFDQGATSVQACSDQAVPFTVLIAARRNGGGGNVFADLSSVGVTFAVAQTTEGMTATLGDSTIAIPAGWATMGSSADSVSSDTIAATVMLPAKAVAGSGTLAFNFAGVNSGGGAVLGTSTVPVSWTTKKCITDAIAPTLSLPSGLTVEATSALGATVTFAATATDETAPAFPAVSCTPVAGSVFELGTTTVSCSATDAAGNVRTGSFGVTVQDSIAPSVAEIDDVHMEAEAEYTVVWWEDPVASDAVSGAPPVTCSPASGTSFSVGETDVTCTATDGAGNTGSMSFLVAISDTQAPSLIVPGDISREATGPLGATVDFTTAATDLVEGDVAVDCTHESGETFPLGDTLVECSASDSRGNAVDASFVVTVVDSTPPTVTVPASFTAEATGPDGATVEFAATAHDIVDEAITPVCAPASATTLPMGETTVTCTATDAAGNTGSETFVVTVVDSTPPDLDVPTAIVAEATGPDGAIVEFTVTADDIVDGDVTVDCSRDSGETFALGTHQVDCTATDAAGNSASESFSVEVIDSTEPTISWPGGPVDGQTYVFGAVPAMGSCTATDTVDGSVPCEIEGYGTTVGSHTATATAVDKAGNTATEAREYSVDAWRLGGFFQPVDMNGVWNSVKGGSTVPLKFEVFAGSTELVGTSAVKEFTVKGVACPGTAVATDDIELTTTGGTTLRYDSTAGQFIQNWQTPKKPGACYQVTMSTQDGSSLTALFKLK
ncbi:HYR domain-containing protein [Microbacterium sp. CFBP9034]|uniref:HYR domain-containing protein n=1 Tax=Microbacterium sp. CFBP9034 TaxID=3096540 RepID=UPI002A6A774C|nr:HYR domain-containing protein [Microbacterium sp. CFBP9034]MDY0910978.1 HYR domain-containing protein [Microbacterium sp. CFBP9034]